VAGELQGVIADRDLPRRIRLPEEILGPEPTVAEFDIPRLEVSAERVAVQVLGGDERRSAPDEGIDDEFPLVREKGDDALGEGDREGRRVEGLVRMSRPFIEELPDAELALEPLLGRETVDVVRRQAQVLALRSVRDRRRVRAPGPGLADP